MMLGLWERGWGALEDAGGGWGGVSGPSSSGDRSSVPGTTAAETESSIVASRYPVTNSKLQVKFASEVESRYIKCKFLSKIRKNYECEVM